MQHGHRRWACVVVALFGLLLRRADGFVYEHSVDYTGNTTAYIVTEGPMFAGIAGGPQSVMAVDAVLASRNGAGLESRDVVITVAFAANSQLETIGWPKPGLSEPSRSPQLCCTLDLYVSGACGVSEPGELIIREAPAGSRVTATVIRALEDPVVVKAQGTVTLQEQQWIVVSVCSSSGKSVDGARLTGKWSFRNPYGYLPGWRFGYLPYFGALGASYAVFALVFGGVLLWRREHALMLQAVLVGIALVGALEMGVLFGVYASHNESGQPFCCPTRPEILAASVLTALKWSVSHSVLLAVCLGFGVVVPSLPRRQLVALGGLTVAYFAAAVWSNLDQLDAEETSRGPSLANLPVLALNAVFIVWILGALQRVRRQLGAEGQDVKLRMYDRLAACLFIAVAFIVLLTVLTAAVTLGIVALPWEWFFLFTNQFDVLYAAILIAVGVIWFPGPTAAQYAYYAQAAMGEDDEPGRPPDTGLDDTDDEDDGGEDAGEGGRAASTAGSGRHASSSVGGGRGGGNDDHDDGDDGVELAAMGAAAPAPGRVGTGTHSPAGTGDVVVRVDAAP